MRVAALQFRGDGADQGASRAALARWLWGVGPGCDLVVCPELATSNYLFAGPDEARAVSELPTGPTYDALSPIARALGTWVVCGFVEQAKDRLFNSAMVIDPSGSLRSVYRKTLLFEADETWATVGDSGYQLFETQSGSFAVGICMDLNDPEFVAWLGDNRPTALAFPTNWLEEGDDVWSYWAWRLDQAKTALVAANSWGPEGDIQFSGRSVVMRPRGVVAGVPSWAVLDAAERTGDALIRGDIGPTASV